MKHFRNTEHPENLLESTSSYTRKKAGYGFKEASALNQIAKTEVPVLFIHGGSDSFVPTEMVYRLYEACPGKKDLIVFEGAELGQSLAAAEKASKEKVAEFLDSCGLKI